MAKYEINENADLVAAAREVEEFAKRRETVQAEPDTVETPVDEAPLTSSGRTATAASRPNRLVYLGLSAGLVVALCLLTFVVARAAMRTRPVPNVVGQKADAAEKILERAGLQVSSEYVSGCHEAPGTVIAVLPAQGTKVRAGTSITLKVASANKRKSGKNALPVGTTPQATGGNTTDPAKSGEGEKVKITTGENTTPKETPAVTRDAAKKVTIPPVEGMPIADGRLALESLGLRVELVPANDPARPDGIVLNCDPTSGAMVPPGAPVRLRINERKEEKKGSGDTDTSDNANSSPPPPAAAPADRPMVVVPDYTGMDGKVAATDMYKRNLKPEWIYQQSDRWTPGTVVITNPPAGSRIAQGSKVTIILAK